MTTIGRWTRGLGLAAAVAFTSSVTSAVAGAQQWMATLNGATEAPPNASAGTGFFTFTLSGRMLTINGYFSGLSGNTTAAHIHCCLATPRTGNVGVATAVPNFVGFPLGVTNGTFNTILDLDLASTYNPAFITANGGTATSASVALLAGMNNGRTYLNIHSSVVPSGEIRGFIEVVPEPSTYVLMGTGLLGLAVTARRRRRA